jgi:hypothetical protein
MCLRIASIADYWQVQSRDGPGAGARMGTPQPGHRKPPIAPPPPPSGLQASPAPPPPVASGEEDLGNLGPRLQALARKVDHAVTEAVACTLLKISLQDGKDPLPMTGNEEPPLRRTPSQCAALAAVAATEAAAAEVSHVSDEVVPPSERALWTRKLAALKASASSGAAFQEAMVHSPAWVEAVRASVEEGLDALAAASRKAAADTEALDVGFQERVRRNYDMLTEAVRLMGVVSGDAPVLRRREPVPAVGTDAAGSDVGRLPKARGDEPRSPGLRGRLKLEPMAGSEALTSDGLDWNDLVDDGPGEAPLDLETPAMPAEASEALEERIVAAIRRMGVDPNALLPRARVEEAAHALAGRNPDGARQIVRRVAPAAVRSVSRRVLTDPDLRTDAEAFVRGFSRDLATRAAAGDGAGLLGRLASAGGRAFMLLDAAVGDLA